MMNNPMELANTTVQQVPSSESVQVQSLVEKEKTRFFPFVLVNKRRNTRITKNVLHNPYCSINVQHLCFL